jgi:plasmid maintenance system antidote protein VapI
MDQKYPDDLLMRLRVELIGTTQRALAQKIGISTQYMNDILRGRRRVICPAIIRHFNLKKIISVSEKS